MMQSCWYPLIRAGQTRVAHLGLYFARCFWVHGVTTIPNPYFNYTLPGQAFRAAASLHLSPDTYHIFQCESFPIPILKAHATRVSFPFFPPQNISNSCWDLTPKKHQKREHTPCSLTQVLTMKVSSQHDSPSRHGAPALSQSKKILVLDLTRILIPTWTLFFPTTQDFLSQKTSSPCSQLPKLTGKVMEGPQFGTMCQREAYLTSHSISNHFI